MFFVRPGFLRKSSTQSFLHYRSRTLLVYGPSAGSARSGPSLLVSLGAWVLSYGRHPVVYSAAFSVPAITYCYLNGSIQHRGGKSARSVMIVTNGRLG